MSTFAKLFEDARKLPPKDQSGYVSARLEEILATTELNSWRLGDSTPASGARMLIGVAPYSLSDLELLDALQGTLTKNSTPKERIDIRDILGTVHHTPIVGIWENGKLIQKASGSEARRIVINRYQIDSAK